MIPRNLSEQAQVRMLVADKLKVKHLAFDMMNKQLFVQKVVRLPFESLAVNLLHTSQNSLMVSNLQQFYNESMWPDTDDEVIVTCLSKRHRTLVAISGNFKQGHIYYKRMSETFQN